MAAELRHLFFRPTSHRCVSFRRLNTRKHTVTSLPPPHPLYKPCTKTIKNDHKKFNRSASLGQNSSLDQIPTTVESKVDINRFVDFLYQDLPHVFDDQGIDHTMYDERFRFSDPITKFDTLSGYLSYIAMLKILFRSEFHLHYVKQTGPYEITTRWTMKMKFVFLPWQPRLVFTGTSIFGINPEKQNFCSNVDIWDSIENNDYFSAEGLLDVIKQSTPLQAYETPDLEWPMYNILKRTANYEVRKYSSFVISGAKGNKLSDSTGFTQAFETKLSSKVVMQNVLPSEKDFISLLHPNGEELSLGKVEKGFAVVSEFRGEPTEEIIRENERRLRLAVLKDGLKPKEGCLLARYNDPDGMCGFMMRNEVLIWLEDFRLD